MECPNCEEEVDFVCPYCKACDFCCDCDPLNAEELEEFDEEE